MSWYNYGSQVKQEKSAEQALMEGEMCDVCGRTFHYTQITRVVYYNKKGTKFVIRKCPTCNIQTLTQYL